MLHRPSPDYCCLMPYSAAWLKYLNFKALPRPIHFDPHARVLSSLQKFKVLFVCSSDRVRFYVSVTDFQCVQHYGLWSLLVPTPFVFSHYGRPAFDPRYCSMLHTAALTEFCACAFVHVLYTAYQGGPSSFGEPIALQCDLSLLLPLLPVLLVVAWLLNHLVIV